ncbi:unnamed protein product (macronuclear) [Paramecium tetraurelia]|uniref:Uncharacterized protein n=1 Tax=Paramecium tetraurelia TaxID=5888 RepID=A0CDA2_PARTE|nr:uncharacterized protein GSPATT00006980001 [Paramecium tetraurelia]CAK68769.1 unnamed protein product [Paramecium tetraurelia]|eukprot:XP_001436166.1 hypothetical protein (macronuclear) [Paramecium tetraurelia strain d4-2]
MSKLDNLKNLQIQQLKEVNPEHGDQAAAVKFTSNRINALEKFVRDSLHQDKEYFAGEKSTLQNIIETLTTENNRLLQHLQVNREQKQQIEADLKISQEEIARLKAIVPQHDEKQLQNEIQETKKTIVKLNKMRQDEANGLNINDLKQLNIKNKDKESPVNELWIWSLVVIYKEPASSYYWNNFKGQVFENAEGAQDFKDRLGRVKAVDMKKDEFERTQNLLKQREQILAAEILTPAIKTQIASFFKIVDLMIEVERHSKLIHNNEKLLQQLANEKQQIQSETNKNQDKAQILKDRITFLDTIHKGYQFMYDAMVKKIHSYQQAQILNDKFTEQIEQSFSNLDFSKSYDQQYVPQIVQTIQHEKIENQDNQQMKVQQVVVEEQQQQNQQKVNVIEVKQTPQDEQIDLQQQPPTEIVQTKTGGCEACNIF